MKICFDAEIDNFLRLAQRALHLIDGHSHLNGLRLGLLLLLLLTALPCCSAPLLLLAALLLATLLLLIAATLRVLRIVADRHQLPDRVFDISGAGFRQSAFGNWNTTFALL